MVDINPAEINCMSIADAPYLEPLSHLAKPPSHLYVRGLLPRARHPTVAIVGTRRPTSYGKDVSYDLAYKLAKKGVVIMSGLAFGVDALAHRGALDAGGRTIAVLAGGLDHIYPAAHTALASEILARGGAIISEYPPGSATHKHQFLARNRLISGLADVLVVTEAGERSGTLSTVNHALDQNKEVFAVPGSILSRFSIGPNRLIQQGARPLIEIGEVLELLNLNKPSDVMPSDPRQRKVIGALSEREQSAEQLAAELALDTTELLVLLSELELEGIIHATPEGKWRT